MYKRAHLLLTHLHRAWDEKKGRLAFWFWLLLGYFLSQAAIQALNFVAGVVIIRSLSKEDYATYTIINTMGPVLAMLSDNGITLGLFAVGRKIWQDNEKMGSLVRTGLDLRRLFGFITLVLISPILIWMLARNHASVTTILLLMAIVVAGTWLQLNSGVIRMVIELRQQVAVLRNVGLAGALLRFLILIGLICFFSINAWLATFAATCAAALEAFLLFRSVRTQLNWQAPPSLEYRSTIFSLVKKTAPLTVYFCLQSQVSIWLISVFGQTHQVADIGALERLGMIFTLLGSVYSAIVVPRFSRSNGRERLLLQFGLIGGSFAILLTGITLLTAWFPQPLLLILGPQYTNASSLIWLAMLSSGLGSFMGLIWGLNTSKGWLVPALITIPVEIVTQILLLLTLDLGQSRNVLIFSCLSTVPPIILNLVFLFRSIQREEEEVLG